MAESKYEKDLLKLKAKVCKQCRGSGSFNISKPGANEFEIRDCPTCKGSGYQK